MDAAELTFIHAHLSSLPALRQILDVGRLHRLSSTAEVFPGSVWPTFYSGLLPGDHGIYHHLQWDSDAMQLRRVTQDWLYLEPFWYELERRGLRVAAIDVPMSFPSRLDAGAEVINWGSHDELGPFRTHPDRLSREIREKFGRHPMGSEIPVRKNSAQLGSIRQNLIAGARLKSELSRWLLAQADWDFFLTVFGETHRGGHLLWPEENADSRDEAGLLDVYRAVDRGIGELVHALPEGTTLVVFAVHGMGRNGSQEHFIPKLMDRMNARFLGQRVASTGQDAGELRSGQHSVMRTLRERLPAGLQNAIARAVPVAVRDMVVSRQVSGGHDWQLTPGIALLADLNGYLRWNLRGRERQGMLQPGVEGANDYIAWVCQCLLDVKAPDGSGLVRDVLLSRDHFPGRRTAALPDAVVRWSGLPPTSRAHSDSLGGLVAELSTGRSGNHRPDGFCVIVQPPERSDSHVLPPSHISELSTTVCGLLGQPHTKVQS